LAPYQPIRMKNGEIRKKPIRNQIDYILIDNKHLKFVTDSRSFTNTHTESDHNLVLMTLKLQLSRLNRPKKDPNPQINIENFKKPDNIRRYRQKVDELIAQHETVENTNDQQWTNIVSTCHKAGEEVLGLKEKQNRKNEDKEITTLKENRQRLKHKIDASNSPELRKKLENDRRAIKAVINKKIKKAEEEEVDQKLEKLESVKDDNTKYYYVMRDLQNTNRDNKTSIILKDKHGNIPGSNIDKIKIIEEYFKTTLSPPEMKEELLKINPCKMRSEFTATEIQELAKRLNNNKAAGPDQLKAEFIKYAPLSTFEQIASIFNRTAATGEIPEALIHGILQPIQKPGKPKGPPENCRSHTT
jgi:hypothetical protein